MPSVKVASKPPYNMSYGEFLNLVNKEEKEAIRSFVSKYSQLNMLFPLSDNHLYGGYHWGISTLIWMDLDQARYLLPRCLI